MIGEKIPDEWSYTDEDLRTSFGDGNERFLDDAREWITEGWSFTEADLLDELDSDQEQTLEDIRDHIENGYTVTEVDLKEEMDEQEIEDFDDARHTSDTVRSWLWLMWLAPLMLLIPIGFLGGRDWRSRLLWAFITLFTVSLIAYFAIGLTYSHAVKPEVKELINPSDYEGLEAVVAEKADEVVVNVFDSAVSEIQSEAVYVMIGSGIVALAVVGWSILRRRRAKQTPPSG